MLKRVGRTLQTRLFTTSLKSVQRMSFKEVEAAREGFNTSAKWKYTKSPNPQWTTGSGASSQDFSQFKKIPIDPYGEGRATGDNYRLLISAVVPRPIGFVSTISSSGLKNLAPFSYFTMVNHDPPIFVVGFAGKKDTINNLIDTGECTINIISEWFVEAANSCSTEAPPEVNEWELSGLTPVKSNIVKSEHALESAFSIEAKLVHKYDWVSKNDPDKGTGTTVFLEGVQFHAREDVINERLNQMSIEKLQPVARLGGITYGRVIQGYEKPRPAKYQETTTDNK